MKLFLAPLAFLAVLAGCATTKAERPEDPVHYVMRHLQKAGGPDPALTEAGRRNASYLAALLHDPPPRAIYASTTRRARETAEPAAERYGVTIKEYDPSDTPALIARVRQERGPVLIVGHSNTVPGIVEALGGPQVGPIAEGDYGIVYRLSGRERRLYRMIADHNCDPLLGGPDDQSRC